ncbi:BolA family protein [Coxiella endosymbiont of Amblyomma nuttalli]|uniref:BolA family protein n=1 Tax=Coxiella endosymbiont of Amblyomma nuttalli TaxID=2749996 RepID=UPI001BA49B82|nr:BolA/IbaG family iron-sulfur metabolism protein [Coxiella endosymbiont of Amblyomma nuttalli]QTS83895.1 transcriptional regulator BolA [Coxiella endosymbiont of Amblyomma nuttalli]
MVTGGNIKEWIEANLPESHVVFIKGDGYHFEGVVLCSAFEGKTSIARHRLVYAALGDRLRSDIHALSLKTYTPNEYKGD